MKIKNRKRLNIIIAAFVAIFVAGGAFAFVAQGPLLFSGTANVDAELELSIMDVRRNDSQNPSNPESIPENRMDFPNRDDLGKGISQVFYSADLAQPGENAHFVFDVQNTGTMDAVIYSVAYEFTSIDGIPAESHPDFAQLNELAGGGNLGRAVFNHFGPTPFDMRPAGPWTDKVIKPGETDQVYARMFLEPIPEEFELSKLQYKFGYTLSINYGLAN